MRVRRGRELRKALAVTAVVVAVTACAHRSSGGGHSGPYASDYTRGYNLGQEFVQVYNVMPSPSQCQIGFGQVNTSLTGQALSALRQGFIDGCEAQAGN